LTAIWRSDVTYRPERGPDAPLALAVARQRDRRPDMNIPLGTVKTRTRSALTRLAKLLSQRFLHGQDEVG